MNPEKFSFELYACRQGITYADIFAPGLDIVLHSDVTLLGWCEAKRLRVRPRTEGYAIMVRFDSGEECWTHCPELPAFLRAERDLLNERKREVTPEIVAAFEYGFKCAERGLSLNSALVKLRMEGGQ